MDSRHRQVVIKAIVIEILLNYSSNKIFFSFISQDRNKVEADNATEFKTCKAANIQGQYKTISADDEIIDQMFAIVSKKSRIRIIFKLEINDNWNSRNVAYHQTVAHYFLLDASEEYRKSVKDRSTIVEYSNNGKGTYRVKVTSDTLPKPKIKMFRIGTAYQRLVGLTENKNDHTIVRSKHLKLWLQ